MQVAMLAAGFTAGEADQLRRAMAAWRSQGGLEQYYERIVHGMVTRGYDRAFAESIFAQIRGFGEYGFPESHAASFALLVYVSAWLKCHAPAVFLCALLNSQPMGFYTPSQLVQDARRHGVEVLPVDVTVSDWDSTLQGHILDAPVRLGLSLIRGLAEDAAARIELARAVRPFADVTDLARRAQLTRRDPQALASANALASLAGNRRGA
jgi:error-prone DNA polymerase